ncbi:hypothetical protein CPHO_08935 [Corynebacterium phocae]|uniref:Uncharacterized protein n=1 Tax=Corynebacterium phocae TaxID=161895 RepID=A0A1L7D4Z1_9CORY|nr:hypothetical protein CPHO_08935 [Corynebacterium phocae]
MLYSTFNLRETGFNQQFHRIFCCCKKEGSGFTLVIIDKKSTLISSSRIFGVPQNLNAQLICYLIRNIATRTEDFLSRKRRLVRAKLRHRPGIPHARLLIITVFNSLGTGFLNGPAKGHRFRFCTRTARSATRGDAYPHSRYSYRQNKSFQKFLPRVINKSRHIALPMQTVDMRLPNIMPYK